MKGCRRIEMRYCVLLLVALIPPSLAAPLNSAGVSISNQGEAGITAFNSNTLEQIQVGLQLKYKYFDLFCRSLNLGPKS